MQEPRKRIRIPYNGTIPSKGNIIGPVISPYYETISEIGKMVSMSIPIIHVMGNGTEIPLNSDNYNDIATLEDEPVPAASITTGVIIEPEISIEENEVFPIHLEDGDVK